MSHQRQLIREAIKDALVDADTAAETRVFARRFLPFRNLELPAIAVYPDDESGSESGSAPLELQRVVPYKIEAAVKANQDENLDDLCDDLALEIERAIHADDTLDGTCSRARYAGTDFDFQIEGDRIMGVITITYNVIYYTYAPEAADVTLDDFATADIRYTSVDGDSTIHADNQAHDTLEDLEE